MRRTHDSIKSVMPDAEETQVRHKYSQRLTFLYLCDLSTRVMGKAKTP
jgi:hypothetical protein